MLIRRGSPRRLFFLPFRVYSPYRHLTIAHTSRSVLFRWSIPSREAEEPFTVYGPATHLIMLDSDNPRLDPGIRTGLSVTARVL